MKKLTPLLLLFLALDFVQAQKIDSLWTSPPFTWETQTLTIAPDGTLIAAARENYKKGLTNVQALQLTGINTETGAVKWKFPKEFTPDRVDITGFDIAPNTPFIVPKGTPLIVIDLLTELFLLMS
ncbi:MAG: hypothetical protein WDO15_24760 [Bacteroidota bacterium]